ncbi:MAG: HEAT repeat domain-containing protein [Chloroflexota bacterium]|nr:HEAT repeat domain-containing protein [Chloroflexota bacterium]
MVSDFEAALDKLADGTEPLDRRLLKHFSVLTRAEERRLEERFGTVDRERRRQLLKKLIACAEEDFRLDYTAFFYFCLDSDDPVVRRRAIEGLWEEERAAFAERLLEMLASDPAAQVRAAAAEALGRFLFMAGSESFGAKLGPAIQEALDRAIHADEDTDVVRRAIESIAYVNEPRVYRIIEAAYEEGGQRMRESAVFAMGRSAVDRWTDIVIDELGSRSPAMRYEAARACGEIQAKRAVDPLGELLGDADPEVRTMAVWALGQIGGERAEEILEYCVEEGDEVLREAASEALEELRFLAEPLSLLEVPLEGAVSGGQKSEQESEDEDEEWADEILDMG